VKKDPYNPQPKIPSNEDKLTQLDDHKVGDPVIPAHIENEINSKDDGIFMSNVISQAGFPEDALCIVKGNLTSKLQKHGGGDNFNITEEQLSLLLRCYRNIGDKKVSSLKSLRRVLRTEEKKENILKIEDYIKKIKGELVALCNDAIRLSSDISCRAEVVTEREPVVCRVLVQKLQADSLRLLLRLYPESQRLERGQTVLEMYQTALVLAQEKLTSCHYLTLQLSLDVGSLCFKVLGRTKMAQEILSKAFDGAIRAISNDNVTIDKYSESIIVLQKIRDFIAVLGAHDMFVKNDVL